MSAAATSAGYLYASGRLRGRGVLEPAPRERIRAAAREQDRKPQRHAPRIEYRVRKRWSLE